ncbi:MAG TPA: hypothetical protein ENK23_09155 [Sorangium sp.]|nr:hypothetical protein [Sorangium sp.]
MSTWTLYAELAEAGKYRKRQGFISFDRTTVMVPGALLSGTLQLTHVSTSTSAGVRLWGGSQPLFGTDAAEACDITAGAQLLDTALMGDIVASGQAWLHVPLDQLAGTVVQFRLDLDTSCPFNKTTNQWRLEGPGSTTAPPVLWLNFQP